MVLTPDSFSTCDGRSKTGKIGPSKNESNQHRAIADISIALTLDFALVYDGRRSGTVTMGPLKRSVVETA